MIIQNFFFFYKVPKFNKVLQIVLKWKLIRLLLSVPVSNKFVGYVLFLYIFILGSCFKVYNYAGPSSLALPQIDENNVLENKNPKDEMLEMLDKLESHVEKFRKEAAQLEEEKDKILASLDSIRHTDSVKNVNESKFILITIFKL